MSVLTITNDNFQNEVMDSSQPVLVDFWASWCGPCRMVSPIVDEISEDASGKFKVGKINVDEQPDLAAKYNVMSIPTLIVFKDGAAYKTTVGVRSKPDILAMLE
jgi:thioredoxin 1